MPFSFRPHSLHGRADSLPFGGVLGRAMVRCVLGRTDGNKVLNQVVLPVSVDVMNVVSVIESMVCVPHQSVLKYIAHLVGQSVGRSVDHHVPVSGHDPAAFPFAGVLTLGSYEGHPSGMVPVYVANRVSGKDATLDICHGGNLGPASASAVAQSGVYLFWSRGQWRPWHTSVYQKKEFVSYGYPSFH